MSQEKPILHILVVGFHHKKGCQVEFSYPPLISGTEGRNECPSGWKYLPTLALPDGSHNYSEDAVFFNLPSLYDPTESIYGVSCYRQIPVEKLKIRTADVTRSTVQKSVCILASLPLYGYIEVKLSLIANAFFEQGDFSCTDILVKAYDQLNACVAHDINPLCHIDVGLPLREIILKWRHKTLLLFKLFLLQRRVVCFSSPVRNMCTLVLGIASLFPRLLQNGFQEVACVRTSRPMSPMPDFSKRNAESESHASTNQCDNEAISQAIDLCMESKREIVDGIEKASEMCEISRRDSNELDGEKKSDKHFLPRDASVDALASTLNPLIAIKPELWNAPVPIFSSGHLCLPYLSLPYMDLLTDPSVLSYIIGTSNILFHQKKNLADVQIDVEAGTIETGDLELRRQLVLTTEDLRFVDYVLRHVQNPKEGAEGSEVWIREQFQGYILALLKTAISSDNAKDCEHFNGNFMLAWKKSQSFLEWHETKPADNFFDSVPSGHPFAGTLSVADMKLKLAQTMHNSESGRKINQAVNTTSKAVGGAISQAKGAFSNWWSSITTNNGGTNQHPSQQHIPEESNQMNSEQPCTKESESDEQSNDGNKSVDGDITEGEDLCEQIENINESRQLVEAIVEENCVQKKEDGIVEIAKEAELLDSNKRIGGIYTV